MARTSSCARRGRGAASNTLCVEHLAAAKQLALPLRACSPPPPPQPYVPTHPPCLRAAAQPLEREALLPLLLHSALLSLCLRRAALGRRHRRHLPVGEHAHSAWGGGRGAGEGDERADHGAHERTRLGPLAPASHVAVAPRACRTIVLGQLGCADQGPQRGEAQPAIARLVRAAAAPAAVVVLLLLLLLLHLHMLPSRPWRCRCCTRCSSLCRHRSLRGAIAAVAAAVCCCCRCRLLWRGEESSDDRVPRKLDDVTPMQQHHVNHLGSAGGGVCVLVHVCGRGRVSSQLQAFPPSFAPPPSTPPSTLSTRAPP